MRSIRGDDHVEFLQGVAHPEGLWLSYAVEARCPRSLGHSITIVTPQASRVIRVRCATRAPYVHNFCDSALKSADECSRDLDRGLRCTRRGQDAPLPLSGIRQSGSTHRLLGLERGGYAPAQGKESLEERATAPAGLNVDGCLGEEPYIALGGLPCRPSHRRRLEPMQLTHT
jgi:hypothetical protein